MASHNFIAIPELLGFGSLSVLGGFFARLELAMIRVNRMWRNYKDSSLIDGVAYETMRYYPYCLFAYRQKERSAR